MSTHKMVTRSKGKSFTKKKNMPPSQDFDEDDVDKYGNIKMENVLIEGSTTSATYDLTLTVDSSFEFENGETIAVDDYVISGGYATTHLPDELGPEVERYIQAYVEYKILARDSSVDSQEAFQVLAEIEDDIIGSYADISDDTMEIPDINNDQEDWW